MNINEIQNYKQMGNKYNILLASKSPRRQFLLKEMGFEFNVPEIRSIDETYPNTLKGGDISRYLSELKSKAYINILQNNDILITSDTIVWFNNKVLHKPKNYDEAFEMLKELSANTHKVFTGVCIAGVDFQKSFYDETSVSFSDIKDEDIHYYIENYKPYDKAGAYGIQEWIGYVAVKEIKGSYTNVMGLPTQMLYKELISLFD